MQLLTPGLRQTRLESGSGNAGGLAVRFVLIVRLPHMVILALIAPALAAAQVPSGPSALITESSIRAHMEFLASDAMNGRGSGTRDEWIAATYIAAQMRRDGFQPVDGKDFVETVEIDRTQASAAPTLSAGSVKFTHGPHMLVTRMGSANLDARLQKYRAGASAAGAALLMPENSAGDLPVDARGAALVLFHASPALQARLAELTKGPVTVGPARLAGISADKRPAAPSEILLDDEAYAALMHLADGAMVSLAAPTTEVVGHTWNVVAQRPGSDAHQREQIILLTAHLDHLGARETGADKIYNGADDDASGSIAVLSLAEALAHGPALKRTVVFAWFGSEEAGGFGARYFVGKPVLPLEHIVANLEFEMIGRPDQTIAPHTLWLTGWERSDLGPQLARHGARHCCRPAPGREIFHALR
jgi:aminopeptidase YwaD